MRAEIAFSEIAELERVLEQELKHGGCYLKDPEAQPPLHTRVSVAMALPSGVRLDLPALVVQVVPGAGFMVTFEEGPAIAERQEIQQALDPENLAPPEPEAPEEADGPAIPAGAEEAKAARARQARINELGMAELIAELRSMSQGEKMRLALKGSTRVRKLLAREPNPTLHQYLLRNPRLTPSEVRLMADNAVTGAAALKAISENSDWMSDPAMPGTLVNNPKTPLRIAMRQVDRLGRRELDKIVRLKRLRQPIVEAARKRLRKLTG